MALTSSTSRFPPFQWNNFKSKFRPGNLLYAKIYPKSTLSGIQRKPFTAYLKPIDDGTLAEYQIVEPSTPLPSRDISEKNQTNATKLQNISSNLNNNVNVFQCASVTCPKDSTKCKIIESTTEPNHEVIITTVFCMDNANKVLKEEKKEDKNPNEGIPINSSQTVSRNQNTNEDGVQSSEGAKILADMQKTMKNIFNGGFFNKNPFMSNMNMTNLFAG